MTQGLSTFFDVRCVKEAVAGTKVDTATNRLFPDVGGFKGPLGAPILHVPEDTTGDLVPNIRSEKVGEKWEGSFVGDALVEQMQIWLSMAIKTMTPAGAGDPYTWDFKHTLTSATTPQSYTFQWGDNLAVYDVEYVLAKGLEISGAMDGPMKVKADLFGRNFEVGAFDPAAGSLSNPSTLETFKTNKTVLSIDAAAGTMGTTPKASTLLEFTWKLETGYMPRVHGGANIYYDSIIQSKPKLTVDMTIEFNTGAAAERAFYEAGTRRLFELVTTASGGHTLTLDWSGVYTSFSEIQHREGSDIVAVTTELQLDTVYTELFTAELVNAVASLT